MSNPSTHTKPSSDCILGYPLGLHKGFVVTKISSKNRPMNRKSQTSNRVRGIRDLIAAVAQPSPYEKRNSELLKMGN